MSMLSEWSARKMNDDYDYPRIIHYLVQKNVDHYQDELLFIYSLEEYFDIHDFDKSIKKCVSVTKKKIKEEAKNVG